MAVLITGSAAGRLDPQSGVLLGSFEAGEALVPGPVRLVSGTGILMGAISTAVTIANVPDYLGFIVTKVAAGDPVGVYSKGTRIDGFCPAANLFAGQNLWITATSNICGDTKVASSDTPCAQALNSTDIVVMK